jgi:hypothetical protein
MVRVCPRRFFSTRGLLYYGALDRLMISSFFLSDVVSRQVGRSFSKSFQFQVEVVNKRLIYQVNLCFWIAKRAYGGRYKI